MPYDKKNPGYASKAQAAYMHIHHKTVAEEMDSHGAKVATKKGKKVAKVKPSKKG